MPGEDRSSRSGPEHVEGEPEERRDEEAERRFVDGLVARGEAVPEGTDPLPPGVTHEVVEEQDGVPTAVRRRRFSSH